MKAMFLDEPASIEAAPLVARETQIAQPVADELLIQVQACGICHTDLHTVEGDIHPPALPIIPGHQVIGIVEAKGGDVQGWSIGDLAGVPWLYQVCRACEFCQRGEENLCPQAYFTGFHRQGGYAEKILSKADYTLKIPQGLRAESAAPLLCAGITTYSPLRTWKVGPGSKVAVAGLGGLGHMGVKLAAAMGE